MAERLDGTVALVTGASSGIGETAARTLASPTEWRLRLGAWTGSKGL
jgi:NADP-dependent 3-hydroxy acid dehydrogenase YdfG